MKLHLSTLLLIVTSLACAIGWFSEARRSQSAKAEWRKREASLKSEFQRMSETIFAGADAIASADTANEILSRLEMLVPQNKQDPFEFDTDRDFVDQTAIKTVLKLWKNEKQIQESLALIVPTEYQKEIPKNIALDLAKTQLNVLGFASPEEFIDRLRELDFYINLPFPRDAQNRIDTKSKDYKSFSEFITLAINAG